MSKNVLQPKNNMKKRADVIRTVCTVVEDESSEKAVTFRDRAEFGFDGLEVEVGLPDVVVLVTVTVVVVIVVPRAALALLQ